MSLHHDLITGLAWLASHSLQAGILVLLVLLVQWLFRHQLTNRWRFALWWIVLLRLVLPFGPASAVSLFNFLHSPVQLSPIQTPPSSTQLSAPHSVPVENGSGFPDLQNLWSGLPGHSPEKSVRPLVETATPQRSAFHYSVPTVLTIIWLAGIFVLASLVVVQIARFYRTFAPGATPANAGLQRLLEECRRECRVTRKIDLLETEAVQSPALFGLFRLRLLLPRGLDAHFDRPELRYIFLHELAHVKRGDLWLNWLVTGLQILHWFNPVIWFGFARLRADRELACDELALLRAGDQAGTAYGETVVKLLEHLGRPAAIPGLIGILEDSGQMCRRISMIASFRRPGRWSMLAALLLAALAAVALTDAQSEKPPTPPSPSAVLPPHPSPNFFNMNDPWGSGSQPPITPTPAPHANDAKSTNSNPGMEFEVISPDQHVNYHGEIKGVLLLPDGRPAVNVDVVLQTQYENQQSYLGKGAFTHQDYLRRLGALTSTGPDGGFTLGLPDNANPVSVLALDERGCAQVSLAQLRENPRVILQPWGRIEGTLILGHHPGSNEVVSIKAWYSKKSAQERQPEPMYLSDLLAAPTDNQGRFVLTHVPPGKQLLGRRLRLSPNMSDFNASVMVEVTPGTTMVTNVTESGHLINATLNYGDIGAVPDRSFTFALVMPVACLELEKEHRRQKTDADYLAFNQAVADNYSKLRSFDATIETNGSLRAEYVPSGQYYVEMWTSIGTNEMHFKSDRIFEVPPSADAPNDAPVSLGVVQMIKQNWPQVIEPKTTNATNAQPQSANGSETSAESATEQSGTDHSSDQTPYPDAPLVGVVLLPDGRPATNAEVTLPEKCIGLTLGWGEFIFNGAGTSGPLVRTGPDGSFTMPMLPGARSIAVVNKEGFAQISLEEFRANPQIKLQKWGRLEGTLIINHRTPAEEIVALESMKSPRIPLPHSRSGGQNSAYYRPVFYDKDACQTKTDDQGRFIFRYIPPGEHHVVHIYNKSTRSDLGCVDVKAGETIVANFGDEARTVTGRITFADSAARYWTNGHGRIIIRTSSPNHAKLLERVKNSKSPEETEAFLNSAEALALQSTLRLYSAPQQPDGTFEIKDVAAGNYSMEVWFITGPAANTLLTYRATEILEVPPARNEQDESPVNWGKIKLEDSPQLAPPPTTNTESSTTGTVPKAESAPEAVTEQPPDPASNSNAPLQGLVLLPDGRPATNTFVTLPEKCHDISLGQGEFIFGGRGFGRPLANTGADGEFYMPMEPGALSILALNKEGFAQIPIEQLRRTSRIQLQQWGRIEGTLVINHQIRPNELIELQRGMWETPFLNSGRTNFADLPWNMDGFQAVTDDQGRFVFDFIPPGKHLLSHRIPAGKSFWIFSDLEPVDVAAGAITVTNIGSSGRTVSGRIRIDDGTIRDWQGFHVDLEMQIDHAEQIQKLKTNADWMAFYKSPAGRTFLMTIRNYIALPQADGSFQIDDVQAGQYVIQVSTLSNTAQVIIKSATLSVPPAKSDLDDSPVNWGDVKLTGHVGLGSTQEAATKN